MAPRPQDRTRQTFGQLTVIKDQGATLRCRCACGRVDNYPRDITKPSYRGPKRCPWCCGSPCEICGELVPFYGRQRAATCSEVCRAERHRRIERDRYHNQLKGSPEFKEKRRAYLARLAIAMELDPELASRVTESRRKAVRRWKARQQSTPEGRKQYREMCRRHRENAAQYPEYLERKRTRQRAWYHSLSKEDYKRIFVVPRIERRKITKSE